MTQSPKRQAPAGSQLRVDGHLDDHWSAWFGGLTLTQAELHGLLMMVRDLGVTLISVEVIDPSGQGTRTRVGCGQSGGRRTR